MSIKKNFSLRRCIKFAAVILLLVVIVLTLVFKEDVLYAVAIIIEVALLFIGLFFSSFSPKMAEGPPPSAERPPPSGPSWFGFGSSRESSPTPRAAHPPDSADLGLYKNGKNGGSSGNKEDIHSELRWNAWAEKEMFGFRPVRQIEKQTSYLIRLHLAPFSYGLPDAGVASPEASKSMKTSLKQWLEMLPPEQQTIELDAILITDPSYFDSPSTIHKPLSIDVNHLRELDTLAPMQSDDPFLSLQKNAAQPFVLGHVEFKLHTKSALPKLKNGGAAVAISLWDKSKRIPLDEISFTLCASDECDGVRSSIYGFDGFDALKVSTGAESLRPAGAIHLVELESGGDLFGVFRRQNDDNYYAWPLRKSFTEFKNVISSHLKELQSASNTEPQRAKIGDALLGQFFPSALDNPDGKTALKQFSAFVREHMKSEPYPVDDLPSIFFRIATGNSTEPSLWPLSLMSVSYGHDKSTDFLGRYFRVESPLTNQNYEQTDSCIEDWVLVGPATKGTTGLARAQLNHTRLGSIDQEKPTLLVAGVALPVIDDMDLFFDFIHGKGDTKQEPVSEHPMLLSVLSHHDRNSVYFDNLATKVSSGNVRRQFLRPSAVILNGCGTGEFGASDFIYTLNVNGVYAALATLTEVEPAMAGDFLECFFQQIESAPASGIAIGIAHTKALRCLEQKEGKYGSRVLFYSLLGNSGLKICKPRTTP